MKDVGGPLDARLNVDLRRIAQLTPETSIFLFAAAGRSDERDEFPIGDRKRDAMNDFDPTIALRALATSTDAILLLQRDVHAMSGL